MTSITAALHRKIKTLISLFPLMLLFAVGHAFYHVHGAVTQNNSNYSSVLFHLVADCKVCPF
jgi:hypothetical protein